MGSDYESNFYENLDTNWFSKLIFDKQNTIQRKW